jgi:hypothetical protein
MKALSLTPWWAWVVANGHKPVENRKWNTNFRGEFYIHASIGKKRDWEEVRDFFAHVFPRVSKESLDCFLGSVAPRGAIVGRATLVDVVRESDSPWFFGPYGFMLESVHRTPIVPCKGALGFWNVPADVLAKIREAA